MHNKENENNDGRKRQKRFNIFFYDDEYDALKEFSENAGMSMSNYIRAAIFFNNITVVSQTWNGDINKVIYELNKIGNAVNHLKYLCLEKGLVEIEDIKRLEEYFNKMAIFIENVVLGIEGPENN